MPSSPLDFRSPCGCFVPVFMTFMFKRAKEKKAAMKKTLVVRSRATGVMFGLLLVYLYWGSLIYQCGDLELNPGPGPGPAPAPGPKDNMRQTRLASAGAGGTASLDKTGNQPGSASTPTTSKVKEPTLSDVMQKLSMMSSSMDTKFEEVKKEVHDLREDYAALQGELRDMKTEVTELRQENRNLLQTNQDLTARLCNLERKADDLEGRSKRNNLIFYGMQKSTGETNADCEGMVKDLLTDKLELSEDIEFDRVHRLNSKSDSPVIARCAFYKQKLTILKAKRKLQGSGVFIGEDFSSRVREIRRKLTPHLKKAKKDGKNASMVFDHLFIDGRKFSLGDGDNLIEMR